MVEIKEVDGKRFAIDPQEGAMEIKYGLPGDVQF
jgi:hypothetical protein